MLAGQSRLVSDIDARGFAAAWVRDIPLYDRASATPASSSTPLPTWPTSPPGRSASPWPLAAPSSRCATPSTSPNPPPPSTNSPAAPRHGHRLRRPSHRVPRLRPATPARRALRPGGGRLPPPAPTRPSRPDLAARPHHRRRTPAQARRRPHPLLVTGASGQSPDWIAAHADGWLTYPGSSVVPAGPKVLGQKIQAWRDRIPDGGFRPHATNEWIDLVDDPRTRPPCCTAVSSCRSAATRSSICSHNGRLPASTTSPWAFSSRAARRRSHPGIGGGAAALPVA